MIDSPSSTPTSSSRSIWRVWHSLPLYIRIVIGLILGVIVGVAMRPHATDGGVTTRFVNGFNIVASLLLKLLNAIAPPLILTAVIRALITAQIKGKLAGRLFFLLILNTLVAICIGLLVANLIRPGGHGYLEAGAETKAIANPLTTLLENIPTSILEPLAKKDAVIGVIILAVTFGLATRRLPLSQQASILNVIGIAFDLIIIVLHWIIELVPLAVFAKVAYTIAISGFAPFGKLAWFIVAVLVALLVQLAYYLTRVRLASWVRPVKLMRGMRDAIAMSFSTASSTATMPVTYNALVERVGLRPESASLGALVGSNFNNDGTALYEAMAALFVAQMIGVQLTILQQIQVVLTSVVASVGAAGIPEAGLVTMTLVFGAVGLPTGFIPLLLPVDWFLDRCRTVINVMGDANVSCLLDGKKPKEIAEIAPAPTN